MHRALRVLTVTLLFLAALADPTQAQSSAIETQITVNDEAQYRSALTTLSADASGPHTVTIGGPITLDDGGDPTYTGTEPLTIEGQGFVVDAGSTSRILSHQSSALLTIRKVTFANGQTPSGNDGGAVTATGPVTIEDSTFQDNTAFSNGGAVEAQNAPVTITDSRFLRNAAENIGGAVEAGGNPMVTVTGSEFTENVVDDPGVADSGGGSAIVAEDIEIADSTFTGNRVVDGGTGGAVNSNGDTTITRTTFTGNVTEGAGDGGAVWANGDQLRIADSTFVGNVAADAGGAVDERADSTLITNSVFEGNTAVDGDGGAVDGRTVDIRSSILTGNQATGLSSGGAVEGSDVTISDSVLRSNSANVGGAVNSTDIDVSNTTITENNAEIVGGLNAFGLVRLRHVTLAGNEGATADNVVASTLQSFGTAIANAPTGANCLVRTSTASLYSFDDDDSCGFDDPTDLGGGGDPLLGQIRDNGDTIAGSETPAPTEAAGTGLPRESMYPLNGSPLVDLIPAADCAPEAFLALDQRGVDRPFGTGCDIGAIEAVFPAHDLTDVTPFYEATVRWITSPVNTPDILNGYPDGTFGQGLDISRGQAARMYHRMSGEPDVSGIDPQGFTDLTPFYADAITWAVDQGIFNGYPDMTFRPNDPITRGQFTRSLYGFAGAPDVEELPAHGFSDVTPFYADSITWAKANGLADGYADNTYRQNLSITRGQATRIAYNLARSKAPWLDTMLAPDNMLFRDNTIDP